MCLMFYKASFDPRMQVKAKQRKECRPGWVEAGGGRVVHGVCTPRSAELAVVQSWFVSQTCSLGGTGTDCLAAVWESLHMCSQRWRDGAVRSTQRAQHVNPSLSPLSCEHRNLSLCSYKRGTCEPPGATWARSGWPPGPRRTGPRGRGSPTRPCRRHPRSSPSGRGRRSR